MHNLIPKPASVEILAGEFVLTPNTKINASNTNAEILAIAIFLADTIEQYTKLKPILIDEDQSLGIIQLKLDDNTSLGEEGYELSIQADAALISAFRPAG